MGQGRNFALFISIHTLITFSKPTPPIKNATPSQTQSHVKEVQKSLPQSSQGHKLSSAVVRTIDICLLSHPLSALDPLNNQVGQGNSDLNSTMVAATILIHQGSAAGLLLVYSPTAISGPTVKNGDKTNHPHLASFHLAAWFLDVQKT